MARTHRRPPSEYDELSCPRRCNEAYYPLCGANKAGDTKVFTNDCYMSMENCNQLPQHGLLLIFKPPAICTVNINKQFAHFQFIMAQKTPIVRISMNGLMMIVREGRQNSVVSFMLKFLIQNQIKESQYSAHLNLFTFVGFFL